MTTLTHENWLGLQLLAYLRLYKRIEATELVSPAEAEPNLGSATLARLNKFGVVNLRGASFVCTVKGIQLLENIELTANSEDKLRPAGRNSRRD